MEPPATPQRRLQQNLLKRRAVYGPASPLPQGSAQPDSPSEAELARRKKLAAESSGV